MLFHSCDRVPHVSVGEDENVEDVEEDAEDADDHRQVQVDCVVEILVHLASQDLEILVFLASQDVKD